MEDGDYVNCTKYRLEGVVNALTKALSSPDLRGLSQRAIQARIWHQEPLIASFMFDLRREEELLRQTIMERLSFLIGEFHNFTLPLSDGVGGDTAMADRTHAQSLEVICLDSKERLYLILKQYEWIADFFRNYPQHFYENSFQFVERIPNKDLSTSLKVKVIGLGVAGALAVSGLAKAGISSVFGYEKRSRVGLTRSTIRYQNTSWRAYDVAERLLDTAAYQQLVTFRQKINITNQDGSEKVVTSDRTQVILGEAINIFYDSAERYGATLKFDCTTEDYYYHSSEGHNSGITNPSDGNSENDHADIVGLFTGVQTVNMFPLLKPLLQVFEWPDLESICITWLRISESKHTEAYCTRSGEVGAEKWHFQIFSSRDDIEDLQRVRDNIQNKYDAYLKKISLESKSDVDSCPYNREMNLKYERQLNVVGSIMEKIARGEIRRYDYIFVNAPDNPHNQFKQKREGEDGSIVLEGGYTVPVKITANVSVMQNGNERTTSTVKDNSDAKAELLRNFRTKVIVTGGDACVPPNPQAAYGATLACIFSDMFVNLAVSHAHLNVIRKNLENLSADDILRSSNSTASWMTHLDELKALFVKYYDARGRTENFFQFVQTLICNLYSLPPKVDVRSI